MAIDAPKSRALLIYLLPWQLAPGKPKKIESSLTLSVELVALEIFIPSGKFIPKISSKQWFNSFIFKIT